MQNNCILESVHLCSVRILLNGKMSMNNSQSKPREETAEIIVLGLCPSIHHPFHDK